MANEGLVRDPQTLNFCHVILVVTTGKGDNLPMIPTSTAELGHSRWVLWMISTRPASPSSCQKGPSPTPSDQASRCLGVLVDVGILNGSGWVTGVACWDEFGMNCERIFLDTNWENNFGIFKISEVQKTNRQVTLR